MTETAFTEFGKIKNFEIIVQRTSTKEESNTLSSVNIDLHADDSHVNLYAFHRTSLSSPWVTDELVNTQINVKDIDIQGFKSDISSHESKSVNIQFNCDEDKSISKVQIAKNLFEYTCSIAVGVYVKEKPLSKEIERASIQEKKIMKRGAIYRIQYNEAQTHILIHENHFEQFKIDPNDSILLQFNFHSINHQSVVNVIFELQVAYGGAVVFFSRTSRNPCEGEAKEVPDVFGKPVTTSDLEKVVYGAGGVEAADLTGTYYLCVKSDGEPTSLGIVPRLLNSTQNVTHSLTENNIQVIPPNQNIMGSIKDSASPLIFGFRAQLDKQQEEFITIHVIALKGNPKYRITASNNDKLPKITQDHWNVIGDTLTISSADRMVDSNSLFVVSISVLNDSHTSLGSENKFMVSYNFGSKHTLLRPGLPFITTFESGKNIHYFRLEFASSRKNLTLLKTSLGGTATLFVSFSKKNEYPNSNTSDVMVEDGKVGFFMSESQIKDHCKDSAVCDVYLTLVSLNPHSRILLQYATDREYFLVHQSTYIDLPSFLRGPEQSLRFLYQIPKENSTKILLECANNFKQYNVFVKFDRTKDVYDFPNNQSNDRSFSTAMPQEYTQEDFKQNEVMLVTISSDMAYSWFGRIYRGEELTFTAAGRIVVTDGEVHLRRGERVTGQCQQGHWSYFKLHHHSPDNIVLNFESYSYNAFIFVSKTKYEVSSSNKTTAGFQNFLVRSYFQTDANVVISPDHLQKGDVIQGDYEVSVFCRGPGRFGILYNAENTMFTNIALNSPQSIKVHPMLNTYVEFVNTGPEAKLHITFRSSKSRLQVYHITVNVNPSEQIPKEPVLPTPERFSYKYVSKHEGGIGSIVIPVDSEYYCIGCRHILLILSNNEDTVDIVIKKNLPYSLTCLEDGKELISVLEKKEAENYYLFTRPRSILTSLELQILKGNITVEYSKYPSFPKENTTTIQQWQNDEYFTISFPNMDSSPFTPMFRLDKRYLRITGNDEVNKYIVTYAETNKVVKLSSGIRKQAALSFGFKKSFYIEVKAGQHIEMIITINRMYSGLDFDFKDVEKSMNRLVKIYSANNVGEVYSNKLSTRVKNVRKDLFNHQLTVTFEAPNDGCVVAEVNNVLGTPISFTVEYSSGLKVLDAMHNSVGMLSEKSPNVTYKIDIDNTDQVATFNIHQCMQPIKVFWEMQALDDNGNLQESPQEVLYDRYISQREVKLYRKGTLFITFQRPPQQSIKGGDSGVDSEGEDQTEGVLPTIYNFRFNIRSPNSPLSKVDKKSFIVRNYGSHDNQLIVLDGSVVFRKLGVMNEDRLLKDFNIFINYTLYVADNQKVLEYRKNCDGFAFDYASLYFGENKIYTKSYSELLTFEDYTKKQEKRKHDEQNKMPANPLEDLLTLTPEVFGFQETFKASIVARVLVYPRNVVNN